LRREQLWTGVEKAIRHPEFASVGSNFCGSLPCRIFCKVGFIGVDIFFVISGFVITTLLIKEFDESGRINLLNFYLRRSLRLLPALGLMVFVSSTLAYFLLSPLGMQQNSAKTGIGALLISANWIIPKVSRGYFDFQLKQIFSCIHGRLAWKSSSISCFLFFLSWFYLYQRNSIGKISLNMSFLP
jgi:peptidoglycan/LPS O-acetylase OafA/YrhL